MRLLLVHGRSQQHQDPVKLKADWLAALDKGLQKSGLSLPADVAVDFPFYGDKLDEFARQLDLPDDTAVVPKGSPVFDEYHEFRREVADEMRRRAGITDAQVRAEMGPVAAEEKGVENWAGCRPSSACSTASSLPCRRPPSSSSCATSIST